MTETTVIDPTLPIALFDVDNVLDNEYWRWCADEVMTDDGEFIPEEFLTYDKIGIPPGTILPAGTTVVMPYLWGHGNEGGMTDPTDYEVTLDKAATVTRVVHVILSQYWADAEEMDAVGRFFFIEEVLRQPDGKIQISWGT